MTEVTGLFIVIFLLNQREKIRFFIMFVLINGNLDDNGRVGFVDINSFSKGYERGGKITLPTLL